MATKQTATPWAVLLVKFNDDGSEPYTHTYYQNLLTNAGTGLFNMVDFFRDYSHGNIDIGGSQVFGWFTLPESLAQARAKPREDIIATATAAAVANGVDLSPFWGKLVCTNLPFETFGVQGGRAAVADRYGTGPWVLAEEMGHGYGLYHSMADGDPNEYRDPWDAMSAMITHWTGSALFSRIGPGLNAANMDFKGWLDPARVWAPGGWFDDYVDLRPHHRRDLDGALVARVGPYYAEFRVNDGWDAGIGPSVVLVHRLESNRSWLMTANGQQSLAAGAVFEHVDNAAAGKPRSRIEVTSIDAANRQARLRVSYQPTLRTMKVSIAPYPVKLQVPITVTVHAVDSTTHATVSGEVHLHSYTPSGKEVDLPAFPTDTPTKVTLRGKVVPSPISQGVDFLPPTGEVVATGYYQAELELGVE